MAHKTRYSSVVPKFLNIQNVLYNTNDYVYDNVYKPVLLQPCSQICPTISWEMGPDEPLETDQWTLSQFDRSKPQQQPHRGNRRCVHWPRPTEQWHTEGAKPPDEQPL